MFAQSYNPLGLKHPLTPRSSQQRKQQEHARRQRTKEIERRRQAEFEQLRRMEKGHMDLRQPTQQRQEGEQDFRRQETDMLSGMFDPEKMVAIQRLLPPPLYIINSQDDQEDEGYLSSEDSTVHPPRTIILKPAQVTPPGYERRRNLRRSATDSSTICTEDECEDPLVPAVIDASPLKRDIAHESKSTEHEKEKDDNEDEYSVIPPHIIGAVGDVDENKDEEEDDEDFESFWRACIPNNISCETAE